MSNVLRTIVHHQDDQYKISYHLQSTPHGWNLTYQTIVPDKFGFNQSWINSTLEKGFWKSSQQIEEMLRQELYVIYEQLTSLKVEHIGVSPTIGRVVALSHAVDSTENNIGIRVTGGEND